jgi:hypothetical protein
MPNDPLFRRPRRRIDWSEQVKATCLAEVDQHPRLYEAIKALEWLLERNPEAGTALPLPYQDYWFIKTDDLSSTQNLPSIRLIYRFDDQTVYFWGIHIDKLSGPSMVR